MPTKRPGLALAGLVLASTAALGTPRAASAQSYWTDWTTATPGEPGTAAGTLDVGGTNVGVTFSGSFWGAQTAAGGTDFWTPRPPAAGSPYVRSDLGVANPTNTDILQLRGGNAIVNTIRFSQPITNPLMAVLSLGQPSITVTYNFDSPFEILSSGRGYFGGATTGSLIQLGSNVLSGVEGHGMIRFLGTFSSISWTVPVYENWHGFTLGVQGVASELPPPTTVPEPATVALMGAGLVGVGALARRRRSVTTS